MSERERRAKRNPKPHPRSPGSLWHLRSCQSNQCKLLPTFSIFTEILTNGKFRKFSALVFGFCEQLFSELLEGGSWKRKTLNGEYGQEEGKDKSGGKAGNVCVWCGGCLMRIEGSMGPPNPGAVGAWEVSEQRRAMVRGVPYRRVCVRGLRGRKPGRTLGRSTQGEDGCRLGDRVEMRGPLREICGLN